MVPSLVFFLCCAAGILAGWSTRSQVDLCSEAGGLAWAAQGWINWTPNERNELVMVD